MERRFQVSGGQWSRPALVVTFPVGERGIMAIAQEIGAGRLREARRLVRSAGGLDSRFWFMQTVNAASWIRRSRPTTR